MKEVRLHGANRAAENPRDLIVRQIVIDAEDDGGALFLRQPGDRGSDFGGALRPEERRISGLSSRVCVLARLEWLGYRRFDRYAIETEIDGDAIEPRTDR